MWLVLEVRERLDTVTIAGVWKSNDEGTVDWKEPFLFVSRQAALNWVAGQFEEPPVQRRIVEFTA